MTREQDIESAAQALLDALHRYAAVRKVATGKPEVNLWDVETEILDLKRALTP